MPKAIAAVVQEQRRAYEMMSPDMKRIADQALRIEQELVQNELAGRYKLGELAAAAINDETRIANGDSKIGALGQLAAVLASVKSAETLRRYYLVTTVYSMDDILKLTERDAPSGERLEWTHFETISAGLQDLSGKDAMAQRRELERLVLEEGYSVTDLRQKLLQKGGKAGLGRGRKTKDPKDFEHGVYQVYKAFSGVQKRFDGWKKVLGQETDKVTPKTLAKLDAAIESLQWARSAEELDELLSSLMAKKREYEDQLREEGKLTDAPLSEESPSKRSTKKKSAKKAPTKKAATKKAAKKKAKKPDVDEEVVTPSEEGEGIAERIAKAKRAARPMPV